MTADPDVALQQWADRAPAELQRFVTESNAIEGILRSPTPLELQSTAFFLCLEAFSLADVVNLVRDLQPDARFRNRPGLNVRVGDHVAPEGGPQIERLANQIITMVNKNAAHPYHLHHDYETLHPFTDGNGRSGRAIWAWQMLRFQISPGIDLGFLHAWYYQTLQLGGHRS